MKKALAKNNNISDVSFSYEITNIPTFTTVITEFTVKYIGKVNMKSVVYQRKFFNVTLAKFLYTESLYVEGVNVKFAPTFIAKYVYQIDNKELLDSLTSIDSGWRAFLP